MGMSFLKRFFTLGGDAAYNRAMDLYNTCRYRDAIQGFDKIIQRDRGKSRLHRRLALFYKAQAHRNSGIIHMHEGKFEDAISDFSTALEIIPESIILHNYLGICYNNTGKFSNAILAFEKVLLNNEKDIGTHIRLGLSLRNQGLYDKSIGKFRTAITLNPTHADLRYFLGLVLSNKEAYQEAITEFQKALEINPQYGEALLKLGCMYILAGETQKAPDFFKRAFEVSGHSETVAEMASLLEAQQYDDKTLVLLAKEEIFKSTSISLSLTPFVSPDFSRREDTGLYNTLMHVYNQILEEHPNYADIHFKLARVYERQRKYSDAEGALRKALSINPDFIQARITLGFLYKELRRFQEAATEFSFVVDRGLPYPTVAFNLGLIYRKLGKREEAIRAFTRALELKPGFADAKTQIQELSTGDGK